MTDAEIEDQIKNMTPEMKEAVRVLAALISEREQDAAKHTKVKAKRYNHKLYIPNWVSDTGSFWFNRYLRRMVCRYLNTYRWVL